MNAITHTQNQITFGALLLLFLGEQGVVHFGDVGFDDFVHDAAFSVDVIGAALLDAGLAVGARFHVSIGEGQMVLVVVS